VFSQTNKVASRNKRTRRAIRFRRGFDKIWAKIWMKRTRSGIVYLGDRRSFINKFLSDRDKGRKVSAARGLALRWNQQGMQALRNAVKAEMDEETKSAMSCFLAVGSLRPDQKVIWIF